MKNKITAIIVDDELLAIDIIVEYLKPFSEIEIIGKYNKSKQAVDKIIELKPDLLFLDIKMPVLNGFQLIEAIIEQHNPYIIFTTAFDQYAIKAFEVNAIGYLLKPFDKEKFNSTITKFLSNFKSKNGSELYDGIVKILSEQKNVNTFQERILIKDSKKIFYIPVSDVVYFEASGDYVSVITNKKSHLINDSLSALEKRLSPDNFIRIHRSTIINANCVKEFLPYFNSEYKIVMNNNITVKMSRNYKENLNRVFKEL